MILNWTQTSREIYENLKNNIWNLADAPTLWAILVWDSPASLRYIKQKRKFAKKIGMWFELIQRDENISQEELLETIQTCNTSENISWYIVQLPLPKHIDTNKIIESIDPKKDVDGFHPENQWKVMIHDNSGFVPCTPAGVIHLLSEYKVELSWKKVCIIGRSNIVGKPLALLCINAGATVSVCNSRTPKLEDFTISADIIICATGIPHLVKPGMTHKNAIIIDVWFSVVDGKIMGDADTQAFLDAGNSITPVPGWVGPMTVAMLMTNTYLAHTQKYEK